MKVFEVLMQDWDITFNYNDNRIMCFPHIINICTTHTTESLTDPALADEQAEFHVAPLGPEDMEQSYKEAVERNPIALCRSTVWAVRASGQQRDHFQEIIRTGNANGWFKVSELQLLHDVKTRWDSIFLMIHCFRNLQPVSNFELLHVYILTIYRQWQGLG